jgi:DNA-binding helix-hairpin-helix protein with protein kinase domain
MSAADRRPPVVITPCNSRVVLGDKRADAGSEGTPYLLRDVPNVVAKIWHKPEHRRPAQVHAIITHDPPALLDEQGRPWCAWPLLPLFDALKGTLAGVLMPDLGAGLRRIDELPYEPARRASVCADVADLVAVLHSDQVVLGDLVRQNVLFRVADFTPAIADGDGWQPVGTDTAVPVTPSARAPELLRGEVAPTVASDDWALAVLIIETLTGVHPFAGVVDGYPAADGYTTNILHGFSTLAGTPGLRLPPDVADITHYLPPGLLNLARQTVVDGHSDPSVRVPAWRWATELRSLSAALGDAPRPNAA